MTYAYGHLITTSFTAALVVAFTISGLVHRGARLDLAFAAMFACASLVGIAALSLAVAPSPAAGRMFLTAAGLVYLTSTASAYAAFAPVTSRRPRRYRRFLLAYAASAGILELLVLAGSFDGAHTRTLSPAGALTLWLFASANVVTAPILFARGPMALERHASGVVLVLNPLVAGHDLATFAGALPSVPIGGYFATLSGLVAIAGIATIRLRTTAPAIGDYVIEQRLGAGGMADVFVARRRVPGLLSAVHPRVALKRLRDPTTAALLADEARALGALAHPNIVRLLDAGLHGDEPYLVLELIDGATLAAVLELGPLDRATSAEICRQLCDALAYVHAVRDEHGRPLDLIHRDIKPHNVLIARDGTIKLNDFGIARFRGRCAPTRTGALRGTLRYLAPEQAADAPHDARVDLHAIGLLWFECLTGRPFFDGATDAELLLQVTARARDTGDELFAHIAAIDPTARPSSASELAAIFAPLADPIEARRTLVERVRAARSVPGTAETVPAAAGRASCS